MGFLENIKINYGEMACGYFKNWANSNRQLANYHNHKKFLLQCRKFKVIPAHLNNCIGVAQFLLNEDGPFRNKFHNLVNEFKFKILSLEISHIHWKIKSLKENLCKFQTSCRDVVPNEIYESYFRSQEKYFHKIYNKTRKQQINKLRKLIQYQKGVNNSTGITQNDSEKWFINLTKFNIPIDVQTFLGLGDKFNLPYEKSTFPLEQILTDTENIVENFPQDSKNEVRNKAINIITNHYNYIKNKQSNNYPSKNVLKNTSKYLKEHSDIIITKADKGNVTVAINKSEYLKKTYDLLSDSNTYEILPSDPTSKIQNRMNKLLKKFENLKVITKDELKMLKCENGIFPKLYCLPKIHKPNVPLRPIVSFVGSPAYKLSKHLANLLKFAFQKDQYHTQDSFEVASQLQNFRIPDNYVLISLDVISLFTNIPTDLTKELVTRKWYLIRNHCNMTLEQFLELLSFVIDNSYFKFENSFYRQKYGLGMGNCLSPICSDIVMAELQQTCLSKLSFQVPFFKRFVDDIVTCVPQNEIDTILNIFNSFHPKLQFTVEMEDNCKIPFLDILLIREQNVIITDWYHKPTFSERFLNFNSSHSFSHKINIIQNLRNRAVKLSHQKFHSKNLTAIKSYLLKNSYPQKLINRLLFEVHPQRSLTIKTQNESQGIKYFKIPYVRNLSENLKKIVSTGNIHITFGSENTIGKRFYTDLKPKTPKELVSNVVYKIPCNDCDRAYVGETSRYLKIRLSEHERSVRPHNLLLHTNKTALAQHCENTGHKFRFEETKIVAKQNNRRKRQFQEMIHIKKNKTVNRKEDTQNLCTSYYNLISKIS